jgi:hypothetical protein
MWRSGKQYPDFRTINGFGSGRLKESIEEIFKGLLLFMFEEEYIRLEEYYCDGSTFQAEANKHKITWRKNIARMREQTGSRIDETLRQIDEPNREEDDIYGDKDLAINGKEDTSRADRLKEVSRKPSRITGQKEVDTEKQKQAEILRRTLEENLLRDAIYAAGEQQCGEHCGYSNTDPAAVPMPTRECRDDLRPCYNGMIGTEDQYITGVSVHQNPNDGTCFPQHLEEVLPLLPQKPEIIVADAIFGTEEIYEYLKAKGIEDLLKYPSHDKESGKAYKEDRFHKDNMPYDAQSDSFECPNGKHPIFKEEIAQVNKNGFTSTLRRYECEDCSGCPLLEQCRKGKHAGETNRQIRINTNLEEHKQRIRDKLKTKEGKRLMKQRGHDVETCFGDMKGNQLFRRVHLRGMAKVKTELMVVAMAHNLSKMQISIPKKAA